MRQPSEERRPSTAKMAGAVTITGQLVKMIIQFVGLIAFSRLLSPRDVGLIAMLGVFLMLGEMVRDFGLSQAAIQTPKLTHGQASNLFWIALLIGALLTSGLVLAAPAIATMYREPVLRTIAPWIALCLVINALQTQFQVRLARDFRFAALTVTDAASQLIGLVAGLTAALAGAGYWSLVIQMLVVSISLLIQRVSVAGWLPGCPRREPGMLPLYQFGIHSGLAQLLGYAASNTDSYIIGIRWGANALGVYNRAFSMSTLPASQILAPLGNVALTLLSRRRHDGGDFYPMLWKAQVVLSVVLTFVFALVAALAEPFVFLALGPAWAESATLLSILSVGGAFQVLSNVAFWAFSASGNARQLFLSGLVTRPLIVALVVVGSMGGLGGIAWGFSAGLVVSWFISLAWLRRCDGMPVLGFLYSGLHVTLSGLIAGGMGWLFVNQLYPRISTLSLVAAGFLLVTSIYFLLLLLSSRERKFLLEISKPILNRVRSRFCADV